MLGPKGDRKTVFPHAECYSLSARKCFCEIRMTIPIRPSAESDLDAITAIYAHAVTPVASRTSTSPSKTEMAGRRAGDPEGGYPYIVAEKDGTILGYAYAGAYRTRPAYRSTVEDSILRCAFRAGAGRRAGASCGFAR